MLIALSRILLLLHAITTSAQHISSQNATKFALLYGYPLLAFQKLSVPLIRQAGTNSLVHARVLRTADDREVVKPNADTLYSNAIYDLSREDVAITIPEIPSDQFALFSFYDPFGNNFANVGTGNDAGSGDYTLRLRPADSYGVELVNASSRKDETRRYINSPTLHGTFLIRWLVNATNQEAIHSYQNATILHGIDRENSNLSGTPLNMINWNLGDSSPAEHVLNLLAQLAPSNPPEIVQDTDRVETLLSAAGISDGSYTKQDVNFTTANTSALAFAARDSKSSLTPLNNGWSILQSNKTGDFGTEYGLRTAIAASGYLMLKAPNAVYPSWSSSTGDESALSATANLHLGPDEGYLYTFSRKPPLSAAGFWSLTAYGADGYFIDSSIGVYALGDRSNLTYPSGAPVYNRGSISGNTNQTNATPTHDDDDDGNNDDDDDDEPFQILLQAADIPPPANWTSNWLPGPVGGGDVSALLRWFGAGEELVDGDGYVYPVVTKQGAIRGGGTGGGGGGGGNGSHVNATDGHGSGSVIFDGGVGGIGVGVGTTAVVAGLVLGFAALI
jgi:hypothetical protein